MLNNSNNFTVEAIVAKYVTTVKAQMPASPEFGAWSSGMEFECAPHQQLLAMLWSVVNGNPEEGELLGELAHFIGFFKRNILSEEEVAYLVANYKDAVNHIFALREDWAWQEICFFEFPDGMCDLMTKLLDYEPGETLYIPFVEYGDLAMKFPECKISGRISSRRIWAFCSIRLQANGISYDIPYPESDNIPNVTIPAENSVDCLICDTNELLSEHDGSISEVYKALKPNGRMIIIANPRTLTAKGDKEQAFRKQILEEESLVAIIQLPSDIFRTSKDSFFVMCFDKRQKKAEYLGAVMADATFATREYGVKSNLKRFDVERFVEAVQHNDVPENENVCRRIPYKNIDADILLPAHYLVKKPKLAMGLNHVLKVADMDSSITTGVMPAVTVKDLTSTFEKANLSVSDLSPLCDCGKKEDFSVVKHPCVLLCSNGNRVLVGYLSEVPGTGIAVSNKVNCFETVDADVASATLLLLEEYVSQQIKAMSVGNFIRKFDDNLLSKIKVYPLVYDAELSLKADFDAIDEQQRLRQTALQLEINGGKEEAGTHEIADSKELEELKKETEYQRERMQKKLYEVIERQKQESVSQYEEYRKAVRLRKHALTQSLSSVGSMFNALMNCRQRQCGFLEDSDKLSEISDVTVADAFAYIESRLRSIEQKLAAIADVEENFGKSEHIEPVEFINSYIAANKAGWLRFSPEIGWEDFMTNRAEKDIPDLEGNGFVLRKGDPLNTLYFPKKALTRIFDNIINNAVSHGFTDFKRNDYKIRFSWEASGMDIKLVIENNGSPILKEVNTDDILKYGFSTSLNSNGHNGIGCSEIETIMHDYDGEVKIVSTPEEKYTVKYILTFKRTNTVLSL